MIEEKDQDTQVKKKINIIVYYQSKKNEIIENLLRRKGFKYNFINSNKIENGTDSVIIIDNSFQRYEIDDINSLISTRPDQHFFYVGRPKIAIDNNMNIASATFPSQIYGNLMSALRLWY